MENLKEKNILAPKISEGNLLCIDATSESGSIALMEAGICTTELNSADVGTHGQWLLDNIDMLIDSRSYSANKVFEIDCFATTIGPGSFTGLRIGITTLKGLAWAGDKKIIGISTLRAMAKNVFSLDTLICPVLDARKGQIYGAIYKYNEKGKLDAVVEDYATTVDEFVRVIKTHRNDNNVIFMGKGLTVYGDYFRENVEGAVLAPKGTWDIKASVVGELAIGGYGTEFSPLEIKPLYLREDSHGYKKVNAPTASLVGDEGLKKTVMC